MLAKFLLDCKHRPDACSGYLVEYIDRLYPLLIQLEHQVGPLFYDLFTPFDLPENSYLLHQNEVSNKIIILKTGIARIYFTEKDKEVNKGFFIPGDIVDVYSSSSSYIPSDYSIQLLTPATGWTVQWNAINWLKKDYLLVGDIVNIVTAAYIKHIQAREDRLLMLTAKEHYLFLKANYPHLINNKMINKEHIASYLGIKPGSLSRILAELDDDVQ
jgi:CRP-like cAMP-binding protein